MAALERFRKAGKQVVQQHRFIKPLQEAVYEVRVPTLDDDDASSTSANALRGQTVRFLSTGKIMPGPDNSTKGGRPQSAVSFHVSHSLKEEQHNETGQGDSSDSGDKRSKLRQWFKLGRSKSRKQQHRSLLSQGSTGRQPGFSGYFGQLFDKLFDKGLIRIKKSINAGQDVLETYHEAFLYGEVPWNVRVRSWLRNSHVSTYIRVIEVLATLLSLSLYIRSTYTLGSHAWTKGLQIAVTIFFFFLFCLHLFSAPVRVAYLLSFRGIIDFISVLPIIFINTATGETGNGGIPQILTFFRVLRMLPVIRQLGFLSNTLTQQMVLLAAWVVAILFVGAGIFQWVEREATSKAVMEENNCGRLGCHTFFDSFYFMVVTASTVGYGDINAKSNWGRLVVIFALILALTYIPAQVNRILSVAGKMPYGGSFAARKAVGSRYIILWGVASLRAIQEFLSQVYHPVHDEDLAAFPLRVVIMAPGKPSFELRSVISLYGGLVEYIEGRLNTPGDLDRISAASASAFVLMADKHAPDFDAEDSMQYIRSLVVHRTCGPEVRVVVEMLKPRNQGGAIWDDAKGVEVVCVDAMRFKLLARGCFVKGLTTFCTNLFRTGVTIKRHGLKEQWMNEYAHGQEQEIYPILLPAAFHNLLFEEVVEFVYEHYAVIILALDVPIPLTGVPNEELPSEFTRQVLLYPRGRIITSSDVALAIAPDLNCAMTVSTYGTMGGPTIWQEKGWARERTRTLALQNLLPSVRRGKLAASQDTLERIRARWRSESAAKGEDGGHVPVAAEPHGGANVHGNGDLRQAGEPDSEQLHKESNGLKGHEEERAPPILATPEGLEAGSRALVASFESSVATAQEEVPTKAPSRKDPPEPLDLEASRKGGDGLANGENRGRFSGLEAVVEKVLTWPPAKGGTDRPHPAVLGHHEAEILENLEARTLTAVYLDRPHILAALPICWPENLFTFVAALRASGLPNPPIVFLKTETPTFQEWGTVGHFQDVYFVKGSPVYELDLMRAGIFNAAKIVVLAGDATADAAGSVETAGEVSTYDPKSFSRDMKNIVIAANVERLLKPSKRKERLLCELHYEMSISYLRPKYSLDRSRMQRVTYERNREAVLHFSPSYMEGKAFCASSLQFMLYKTFYNRNSVTILEQLVTGRPVTISAEDDDEGSHAAMRRLQQIPVGPEYANMTYKELFATLLHTRQMLPLGLYRCKGTHNSPTAYVFTNPWGHTVVNEKDLVYVIA